MLKDSLGHISAVRGALKSMGRNTAADKVSGKLVWPAYRGTYVRAKHGPLGEDRKGKVIAMRDARHRLGRLPKAVSKSATPNQLPGAAK